MNVLQMKEHLMEGALNAFSHLYSDIEGQTARMLAALDRFAEYYGTDREVAIFSVPGRSEIVGNHTDHNLGCVLAGAINRDIIAVASRNDEGVIRFHSEGYPEELVESTRAAVDANIYFFGDKVSVPVMYLILGGSMLLFLVAYVLLNLRKKKAK